MTAHTRYKKGETYFSCMSWHLLWWQTLAHRSPGKWVQLCLHYEPAILPMHFGKVLLASAATVRVTQRKIKQLISPAMDDEGQKKRHTCTCEQYRPLHGHTFETRRELRQRRPKSSSAIAFSLLRRKSWHLNEVGCSAKSISWTGTFLSLPMTTFW